MKPNEKHALIEAASVFARQGFEIRMPWEADLDERERELYGALVDACRAYHNRMNHADSP